MRSFSLLCFKIILPSAFIPQDPDYEPRLVDFAAYKASIYARYPPVCEKCAPLVDDEIRKKDVVARSNALGSWLNESKKKDTRRQVSVSNMDRHKLYRELRWWTARGFLWVVTLLVAVSADVAGAYHLRSMFLAGTDIPPRCSGAMGRLTLPERNRLILLLPFVTLLSITWTAWLPTYAHFRRAELQGRKVRVRGRERYIVNLFLLVDIVTHRSFTPHYPADITGRSVGGKNVYSNRGCVVLAPSLDGLPFPAFPPCFT